MYQSKKKSICMCSYSVLIPYKIVKIVKNILLKQDTVALHFCCIELIFSAALFLCALLCHRISVFIVQFIMLDLPAMKNLSLSLNM